MQRKTNPTHVEHDEIDLIPQDHTRRVDIQSHREALGAVFASFSYNLDPLSVIKEVDVAFGLIISMLDALGKWNEPLNNRGDTYKSLFFGKNGFHKRWMRALHMYNSATGDWKDSWCECSDIRIQLWRIATKEGLISVNKDLYNISQMGLGGQEPTMSGEEPRT